jgi:hypothetical protein
MLGNHLLLQVALSEQFQTNLNLNKTEYTNQPKNMDFMVFRPNSY